MLPQIVRALAFVVDRAIIFVTSSFMTIQNLDGVGVRACKRSNNLGDDGASPSWDGGVRVADRDKYVLTICVLSHKISSLSVKPFSRR